MIQSHRIVLSVTALLLLFSLSAVDIASTTEWNLISPEFTVSIINGTLCLTINNQGTDPSVGYNVRIKHRGESNWTELFVGNEILSQNYEADYTIFSLTGVGQTGGSYGWGYEKFNFSGTVDFQVERKRAEPVGRIADAFGTWIYDIAESPWSTAKSYTFSNAPINTPTTTPKPRTISPTETPSSSQNNPDTYDFEETDVDWVQAATLTLLIVIVILLSIDIFYLRKKRSQ